MLALADEAQRLRPSQPLRFRLGTGSVAVTSTNPTFHEVVREEIVLTSSGTASALDVAIDVWDTASTGLEPPPLPDFLDPSNPYSHSADGVLVDPALGSAVAWSEANRRMVVWARDLSALPEWYRAAPLRLPLTVVAPWVDAALVHCSAVAGSRGVVLLVGRSGSGKSTTARLAELSGCAHIADDQVVVSRVGGTAVAEALYQARKFRLDNRALPDLLGAGDLRVVHSSPTKSVLRPRDTAAASGHLPIAALVAPELGSAEPATELASTDMFHRLVRGTMTDTPVSEPRTLRALLSLAQSTPSYSLGLRRDTDSIARDVVSLAGGAHV